jgi:hypothetical protein
MLAMTLKRLRRRANQAKLTPAEYAGFIQSMSEVRDKVRTGWMLYLKDSGERWADLRSLPDDELHEFYSLTRRINERKAEAQEQAMRRARQHR